MCLSLLLKLYCHEIYISYIPIRCIAFWLFSEIKA
jgi:hypothetical protein